MCIRDRSNILGVKEEDIKKILILFNASNTNLELPIDELVNYLQIISKDKTYSENIDKENLEFLKVLDSLTDKKLIEKELSYQEIALSLNMDEEITKNIYNYYLSLLPKDKMTINEFVNFVLNNIVTKPEYQDLFNEEIIKKLTIVHYFTDKKNYQGYLTMESMANLLSLDLDSVKNIYLLYYLDKDTFTTYSLSEFINNIVFLKDNTNYLDSYNLEELLKLKIFSNNENNINIIKLNL